MWQWAPLFHSRAPCYQVLFLHARVLVMTDQECFKFTSRSVRYDQRIALRPSVEWHTVYQRTGELFLSSKLLDADICPQSAEQRGKRMAYPRLLSLTHMHMHTLLKRPRPSANVRMGDTFWWRNNDHGSLSSPWRMDLIHSVLVCAYYRTGRLPRPVRGTNEIHFHHCMVFIQPLYSAEWKYTLLHGWWRQTSLTDAPKVKWCCGIIRVFLHFNVWQF